MFINALITSCIINIFNGHYAMSRREIVEEFKKKYGMHRFIVGTIYYCLKQTEIFEKEARYFLRNGYLSAVEKLKLPEIELLPELVDDCSRGMTEEDLKSFNQSKHPIARGHESDEVALTVRAWELHYLMLEEGRVILEHLKEKIKVERCVRELRSHDFNGARSKEEIVRKVEEILNSEKDSDSYVTMKFLYEIRRGRVTFTYPKNVSSRMRQEGLAYPERPGRIVMLKLPNLEKPVQRGNVLMPADVPQAHPRSSPLSAATPNAGPRNYRRL